MDVLSISEKVHSNKKRRGCPFMKKKHVVLSLFSAALLLAVIAACLVGIVGKSPTASASQLTPNKQSVLKEEVHYPDPTDQSKLPPSVKVTTPGETVLLRAVVTEGSQIYQCKASTTVASGFAWQFQAPFAFLKADDGSKVIHSTGPTWLYTQDGSAIIAKVGQFTNPDGSVVAASATPNPKAIPWLRLDVTTHLGSTGLFSTVDQVQRLYTTDGIAPSSGCDQNAAQNHVIRQVHYTAEYVFWGPKS
jgi:uncharacterized protein DUF3455